MMFAKASGLTCFDFLYPMGWIKIERPTNDDPLWKESKVKTKFEAWVDLVGMAEIINITKMVRAQPIYLQRGQLAYSQETLADRWKWDRSTVNRFLSLLQSTHRIQQLKTPIITIISILNYDHSTSEPTAQPTPNTTIEPTPEPTAEPTTREEVKNIRTKEERNNIGQNTLFGEGVPNDLVGKDKEVKGKFEKPTLAQVIEYYEANGGTKYQAENYFDAKEANGWTYGKASKALKSWQADSRIWIRQGWGAKIENTAQQIINQNGEKPPRPTRTDCSV